MAELITERKKGKGMIWIVCWMGYMLHYEEWTIVANGGVSKGEWTFILPGFFLHLS
jgi:hypothetical protein